MHSGLSATSASRRLRFSGQPDIAQHVVGDIGHADLYRRPADTNGSNEELHLVLLPYPYGQSRLVSLRN